MEVPGLSPPNPRLTLMGFLLLRDKSSIQMPSGESQESQGGSLWGAETPARSCTVTDAPFLI